LQPPHPTKAAAITPGNSHRPASPVIIDADENWKTLCSEIRRDRMSHFRKVEFVTWFNKTVVDAEEK
jgi:hypothetical protein